MDKEKFDNSEENDYLEQLHWQAGFRRKWPARFTPKWKYRIAYDNEEPTLGNRIFTWLIVILLAVGMFFASTYPISQGEYGLPIVIGSIIFLVVIFILLAVRDAEKVDDDDEEFE